MSRCPAPRLAPTIIFGKCRAGVILLAPYETPSAPPPAHPDVVHTSPLSAR